jgi:CheY-like chemotaxis protein
MSPTPLQILQVEDDEDDRVLFAWALKKAGVNAVIAYATEGAECLAKLETYLPEVIFLDINMAGMNGKECLKQVRAQKKFDAIPIFILTTSDHESDINDTFQSGATLYVVKPFRAEDMTTLLKRIFADNWKENLLKRDRGNYVVAGK